MVPIKKKIGLGFFWLFFFFQFSAALILDLICNQRIAENIVNFFFKRHLAKKRFWLTGAVDFAKQQKPEPDKTNSCIPVLPVSGSLQQGLFHVAKSSVPLSQHTLAWSSCTLKAFKSTKKWCWKKKIMPLFWAGELSFCSLSSFWCSCNWRRQGIGCLWSFLWSIPLMPTTRMVKHLVLALISLFSLLSFLCLGTKC